jgi:hypothetical protein
MVSVNASREMQGGVRHHVPLSELVRGEEQDQVLNLKMLANPVKILNFGAATRNSGASLLNSERADEQNEPSDADFAASVADFGLAVVDFG